jgi:hypothetical protein
MLDAVQKTIDTAMEADAVRGVFRVARNIFTDPEIFELEMKYILKATGSISPTKAKSRTRMTISPPTWGGSRSSSPATATES